MPVSNMQQLYLKSTSSSFTLLQQEPVKRVFGPRPLLKQLQLASELAAGKLLKKPQQAAEVLCFVPLKGAQNFEQISSTSRS